MTSPVYVVQFPHPGSEHRHHGSHAMPWNHGMHRRKFMVASGLALDASSRRVDGEFAFWGEWEAPSRVVARWPCQSALPQQLHRPFWHRPADDTIRQNTDPWVFGRTFRYSNCKQIRGGRPSALQRLTRGSVLFFGSMVAGAFVLDTVFVVDSATQFVPGLHKDADEAFQICTVESLITDGLSGNSLTLYTGATFENPVNGMFSFAPCRPFSPDPRFERPALILPGHINPANGQAPAGVSQARATEPATAHAAWQETCQQVLAAGLMLGVSFHTPGREDIESAGAIGESYRNG